VLQYYDPAPHMLDLAWGPLVGALVITKKTWDGFPPPLQKAMLEIAAKSGEELTTRNRKESDESVEAMKKRGLVVHAVTPAIEAEWRAFVEPIYPKLRGMDAPAELFDEVQAVLAEYRKNASSPSKPAEPKKAQKEPPR
jgi:TRAP-type C4-dicarboxylate transport system substrate-binding protein